MYYTYMLRCEDNSIYTGMTTDIKRRFEEHLSKDKKCAKYTMTHSAKKLECAWGSETRVLASKLEYRIKKLPKIEKERLIKNNNLLGNLFGDKIEIGKYKPIKVSSV